MQVFGNIGQNARQLVSKAGRPFVTFTLAESYGRRGEEQVTTWYQVNAFGLDETVVGLLTKGTRVKVLGRVTANPYIDKNTGEPKASLTILASSVEIQQRPGTADDASAPDAEVRVASARPAPASAGKAPAPKPAADPFEDFEAPQPSRAKATASATAGDDFDIPF